MADIDRDVTFVTRRDVRHVDDCFFYHTLDLPGIGLVEGQWDLRGRFDDYIGDVDLRDKTVLDVGTANGFLTFEAEKRGGARGRLVRYRRREDSNTCSPSRMVSITPIMRSGGTQANASYEQLEKRLLASSSALQVKGPCVLWRRLRATDRARTFRCFDHRLSPGTSSRPDLRHGAPWRD